MRRNENEYEYIISTLLGSDALTLEQYYEIKDEYIARNLYLYIFEINAPRGFREIWAKGHPRELVPELEKPTRKFDPNYSGAYNILLDQKIRIDLNSDNINFFSQYEVRPNRLLEAIRYAYRWQQSNALILPE